VREVDPLLPDQMRQRWDETKLMKKLDAVKKTVVEPKNAGADFDRVSSVKNGVHT